MGNAAASAEAAGPFYGTMGRRKQRVAAAAELSVPQDLFQELRADLEQRTPPTIPPGPQYLQGTTGGTDLPDGYAGVHRGKRTTRPRDLPGAGRRISPMFEILGQVSTRQSTDRAWAK
jgi:hypothetical protein